MISDSTDADSMRLWLLIHCWQSVGDNIRPMGLPDQQSYFTLLGDQQWERPQNEIENTGTCIHWVWISCLDDAEYGNHALRWPKHGKWSSQNCSQSSLSRSGQRGFSSVSSIKSYCMTLYQTLFLIVTKKGGSTKLKTWHDSHETLKWITL